MRYRNVAGLEVSILGMGAMRLPLHKDRKTVDAETTDRMVRYAVERGLNYIDTAAPYHDGQSEAVLGQILSGGLRNKVLLTTKQPCWLVQRHEDFNRLLEEQLARLKTNHLDFYLLHALFAQRWESVRVLDVLGWLERKKAQGIIRHIGFSFHDNFEVFVQIMDATKTWEICQIQYNYVDEDFQAGSQGLRYAAARDIPVVVMEPLRGGLLASPPAQVRSIFQRVGVDPVEAALRWLWDKPEVTVVLSGVSTPGQLAQNLEIAERAGQPFGDAEKRAVDRARDVYQALAPIPCTQCGYCMPCPSEVSIPDNLALYNKAVIFGSFETGKVQYLYHTPDKNRASACTDCGTCEERCPQHIPISQWMPRIHAAFSAR